MKKNFLVGISVILLTGCSGHTYVVKDSDKEEKGYKSVVVGYGKKEAKTEAESKSIRLPLPKVGTDPASYLPDATVFRMSGDFSKNVAITLSPSGMITYFPAPSDITADSEPISLGDGWWLNCQGISPNSVFTSYTFAEYASLPETPTLEQLKHSIIPGAKVTDFKEVPVRQTDAVKNIEEVKKYLK